jgi:hypothetical protein
MGRATLAIAARPLLDLLGPLMASTRSIHALARWKAGAGAALAVGTLVVACGDSRPSQLGNGEIGEEGGPGSSCGSTPAQGCPCTGNTTVACGEVTSTNDGYVSCSEGTRACTGGTWGPCIGLYNVIKSLGPIGGGLSPQNFGQPTPDAGACNGNPCDPTCVNITDTSTGIDAGSGLLPVDGGWTLPLGVGEGGTCTGLQCDVPVCGTGETTSITGTVYDPASLNPVYNAVVMIPASASAVQPVPAGVSSDPCGGATLPPAVTYTYSATNGTFTLTGVPVAASVPLVIQIGRWRRIATINTSSLTCSTTATNVSTGCNGLNNYAGTTSCATRLPRIQSEGNIPHIAIATGGLDAIECMLYRMGVSSSEYTDEYGTGRINIFNDGGSVLASPNANDDLSYLMGFTCSSGNCPTGTNLAGITNPSFETGDLTGWTSSGTVAASNAQAYDGNYSALLGSTSSTDTGTEILSQTFTAPAGANELSFYVLQHCGSGGGGDGFSAQLTDNTSGATASWAKNCSSPNGWVNYIATGLTAGDSFTFTATNLDLDTHHAYAYLDYFGWLPAVPPPNLLPNYDLVMLPCDGGNEYNAGNWGGNDDVGRQNLINYAGVGGRVFTSHWGREWIERSSTTFANGPFPNVATWIGDQEPCGFCGSTDTGLINAGAAWGASFSAWMTNVGAASALDEFNINPWRYDTSSVSSASELYVSYLSNSYPADFTFNTPLGSATPDGRVMYTDMHLANGTPSGTFPGNCPTQGSALLDQEDAAEYLLFDLGSCVTGLPIPGASKAYSPSTFTRDYQGTCPAGSRPIWRFFYWEDTTPSNSDIVFTAYTADTEAQLATEFPMATLATAQGGNVCPGGPSCSTAFVGVNVDPALAAAGVPTSGQPAYASHTWLRVNMTLNPSSDLTSAPTLIAWQQDYDCVASE